MFKKQVILVDENDNQTGKMEKLKAHQLRLLHRAFSVFVFNDRGEMLLQKRAKNKYHSGGLWGNACCSHPVSDDIKKEAEDYKWLNFRDLKNDISQNPQNYTEWFKLIYEKVFSYAKINEKAM